MMKKYLGIAFCLVVGTLCLLAILAGVRGDHEMLALLGEGAGAAGEVVLFAIILLAFMGAL